MIKPPGNAFDNLPLELYEVCTPVQIENSKLYYILTVLQGPVKCDFTFENKVSVDLISNFLNRVSSKPWVTLNEKLKCYTLINPIKLDIATSLQDLANYQEVRNKLIEIF